MNIVLIGYRGTGKTSVGKALAARLGRRFFDADVYLERKAGRTISAMVAAEGWSFFRAMEKEVIAELSGLSDCVIATGGGAVMDEDNVVSLKKSGFLVLLTADIPTMVSRIQKDGMSAQQRPDLVGGSLTDETKAVLEERMPVYARVAHYTVDTTHLSVDAVVENIAEYIRTHF